MPPGRPNSFNFMQFLGNFGKIACWRPHLGEILDPPLLCVLTLTDCLKIRFFVEIVGYLYNNTPSVLLSSPAQIKQLIEKCMLICFTSIIRLLFLTSQILFCTSSSESQSHF